MEVLESLAPAGEWLHYDLGSHNDNAVPNFTFAPSPPVTSFPPLQWFLTPGPRSMSPVPL